MRPNTKTFFLESPTNPALEVLDIQAIAEIALRPERLAAAMARARADGRTNLDRLERSLKELGYGTLPDRKELEAVHRKLIAATRLAMKSRLGSARWVSLSAMALAPRVVGARGSTEVAATAVMRDSSPLEA